MAGLQGVYMVQPNRFLQGERTLGHRNRYRARARARATGSRTISTNNRTWLRSAAVRVAISTAKRMKRGHSIPKLVRFCWTAPVVFCIERFDQWPIGFQVHTDFRFIPSKIDLGKVLADSFINDVNVGADNSQAIFCSDQMSFSKKGFFDFFFF